jgi:NADH-quinone oxidoreductase subunit F
MNCEASKSDIEQLLAFDAEADCPVNSVKLLSRSAAALACGRDVLCREGLPQIARVSEDVAKGDARIEDIDLLRELAETIADNAGCEMSREAAGACLRLIDENIETWEKHILRKICTRGVCPDLNSAPPIPGQADGSRRRKRRGRD